MRVLIKAKGECVWMEYKKISIGIDQSYANTGLTISGDGIVLKVTSLNLSKLASKAEKRKAVCCLLEKAILLSLQRSNNVIVITERIRAYKGSQLSLAYVATTGALIGAISDTCERFEVPCYNVDTRVWKAAILGTSRRSTDAYAPKGVNPNKWPTLEYVMKREDVHMIDILSEVSSRCTVFHVMYKGKRYKYNDDAADSVCISLYGHQKHRNLHRENI